MTLGGHDQTDENLRRSQVKEDLEKDKQIECDHSVALACL